MMNNREMIAGGQPEIPGEPDPAMQVITLTDKRILVLGNGELRRKAALSLEEAGGNIMVASPDADLASVLRDGAPHLVLLSEELLLPGDVGLLSLLRTLTDAPIVVIGSASRGALVRALEQGADLYLNRNISPRMLLAYVRALLRRHTTSDANNGEPHSPGYMTL